MIYICVFCSALDVGPVYQDVAEEFGKLLASYGYGLVWGGSNTGLMKTVADNVEAHGGMLYGVSVEVLKDVARKDAHAMIVAKDLNERKKMMREKADAFVALVGGTGTLDELSELIEQKILGYHDKPIVIVNTNDFYHGLLFQYETMRQEGFLKEDLKEVFAVVDSPQDAMTYLHETLRRK